jgi:hypothetical protein
MKKIILLLCAFALLPMAGCDQFSGSSSKTGQKKGSLFAQGCPRIGKSTAMQITNPKLKMEGPDALGTVGDYLLMNDRSAFIIQGPGNVNTYYYYSGILIDAVALDGCAQANLEQFQEIGIFVGNLDMVNPLNSGLRSFRGDRAEIINDGRDGEEAVVRVHGADDIFWTVELTLISEIWNQFGIAKPLSTPYGVDIYIDYILPPDSRTLKMELNIVNKDETQKSFLAGTATFFGNSTTLKYYSSSQTGILTYELDSGLPFLASSSGTGAWVFAMKDGMMGTTYISGIQAALDTAQVDNPVVLEPASQAGNSATITYLMAVGDSDFNSGIVEMNQANPNPIPGWTINLVPFTGYVYDVLTGDPMEGVEIEVQVMNGDSVYKFIDGFETGVDGLFGGQIPDLGKEYRIQARADGRPNPQDIYFFPSNTDYMEVGFMPSGTLLYEVRDEAGTLIPAKIMVYVLDGWTEIRRVSAVDGTGTEDFPPGTYTFSVTRGYEYTTWEGDLTIYPDQITPLQVSLTHEVDTTGWMAFDGHLHAGPSGDNYISIADRIRTVAVEGLEIAVSTDHEFVADWWPGVVESGMENWVNTVIGQEVTCSSPEHINMMGGIEVDHDHPRGGFVDWYNLNIDEIYRAIRDRGAQVIQMNHPGYLNQIDYDPILGTADPALDGHTVLNFLPGDTLWSWDLDAIEIGTKALTGSSNDRFNKWMSFFNHGHRITGHSNTDTHNWNDMPGQPRNYFPSSTDDPSQFVEAEMIEAILHGNILPSSGAFARVRAFDTQDGDSVGMGETISVANNTIDLWVHIEAIPDIDVEKFIVFANCDEVMTVYTDNPDKVVKHDEVLSVPIIAQDAHVVVLGFGQKTYPRGLKQFDAAGKPRFTTHPIFVDTNADGDFDHPGGKTCTYNVP